MSYFVWRDWQNELRIVKQVDNDWWVDVEDQNRRSSSNAVDTFQEWLVFFETSDEAIEFILSNRSENVKMIERIM